VTAHPISVVLDQAMDEQSDLTFLGTSQNAGWEKKYGPDRAVRMPIAENAMMGMAVGMAITGRRTVVEIARAAFLYVAMDPLVNQAALWRYLSDGQYSVPLLVLAITRWGENSGPQHEHTPHALLSQVPGLVVAVPSSPNSAAGLMATALKYPDPVVILETARLFFPGWDQGPPIEPSYAPIPFGVATCAREGSDVTLVGIGNTVLDCLTAAEQLADRGISAQVVDLRTAAPLDSDGVAQMVGRTGAVVLVDETIGPCSLVRDLAYQLMATGAVEARNVRVIERANCPVPASPRLQEVVLPGPARIVSAASELADGRGG
jgi:pyruvate/2-oxoglutarate/acetoin dehydrogenase E1 component